MPKKLLLCGVEGHRCLIVVAKIGVQLVQLEHINMHCCWCADCQNRTLVRELLSTVHT